MSDAHCRDCRVDTVPTRWDRGAEYYMVHDHVWSQTGMGYDDGMLCIGCLEQRIGRTLDRYDFTNAEVNILRNLPGLAFMCRTRRLRDRLTRHRHKRVRRSRPQPEQQRQQETLFD